MLPNDAAITGPLTHLTPALAGPASNAADLLLLQTWSQSKHANKLAFDHLFLVQFDRCPIKEATLKARAKRAGLTPTSLKDTDGRGYVVFQSPMGDVVLAERMDDGCVRIYPESAHVHTCVASMDKGARAQLAQDLRTLWAARSQGRRVQWQGFGRVRVDELWEQNPAWLPHVRPNSTIEQRLCQVAQDFRAALLHTAHRHPEAARVSRWKISFVLGITTRTPQGTYTATPLQCKAYNADSGGEWGKIFGSDHPLCRQACALAQPFMPPNVGFSGGLETMTLRAFPGAAVPDRKGQPWLPSHTLAWTFSATHKPTSAHESLAHLQRWHSAAVPA